MASRSILTSTLGSIRWGTTGLATKVNHGYLLAFGAAAAIGGLGGLAQIGNNSSILDPSTQIRNGISEQTAAEGEQVLNHFLNRLPVITLKEGSRARVYVGRDILIPSYANTAWTQRCEKRNRAMSISSDRYNHLLNKAKSAKRGGHGAWAVQSTGEKVAVALVLNRADWLEEFDYTIAEAIARAARNGLQPFRRLRASSPRRRDT